MSTYTGRAPVYKIAAAVATKVKGVVITSCPSPTPAANNARCKALVPELVPMPCAAP